MKRAQVVLLGCVFLVYLHVSTTSALSLNNPSPVGNNQVVVKAIGQGIRGSNYGIENNPNSTIPTASQAAAALGVTPPADVSAATWKRAWKIHRRAMPLLHFGDPTQPPDSSLSLMCLWWKALAANDPSSPAYDDGLTYDLLPRITRRLVGPRLCRFYPRLHHANVEIRTAFLDQSVTKIVQKVRRQEQEQEFIKSDNEASDSSSSSAAAAAATTTTATAVVPKKIRLVTLGGGYDARSIKLQERGLIDAAVELDLPEVVDAKQKLFAARRFQQRRQQRRCRSRTSSEEENLLPIIPTFYKVDLNELGKVESVLLSILSQDMPDEWHTIILFEGVMIYLGEGVPNGLLEVCSRVLRNEHNGKQQQQQQQQHCGSLVFADRLERIPGGDEAIGVQVLKETGWKIVEWQPKPGLARHMGSAELILD